MPHLIIEYSADVVSDEQSITLVDAVYAAAQSADLFDVGNLKVRALPVRVYRLGTSGRGFVCVQCRIHAGRSEGQKRQLSESIVAAVRQLQLGIAVITAEVIEMERASYSKYVSDL